MAYSDYGAFVCLNGERRRDKEDVGVYDTVFSGIEAVSVAWRGMGWEPLARAGYALDRAEDRPR